MMVQHPALLLCSAAVLAPMAAISCGGAPALGATGAGAIERVRADPTQGGAVSTAIATKPNAGSSDGLTCEQVREQYVEEINMQGGGPADLTAQDFGATLNQGTYLAPCNVPADSKIVICAAIKDGNAAGVTVALEPASPDIEVCVAKQVRALSFPSHPKMDFVTVRF